MSNRCAGVLAAIAVCFPAAAQKVPIVGLNVPDADLTLKLGDGTIRGERIRPHRAAWLATFFPKGGGPINPNPGIWNEAVQAGEWNGRRVLVRSVGTILDGRTSYDIRGFISHVAVVDADTLAPLWSEHHDADGSTQKLIVQGTRVELREKGPGPDAKEVVRSFDTGVPAYDFSGPMFPFYFKALPLKEGLEGVIPAIGDPEHPLRGVRFRVVRREKIRDGARGMVDAWVVESTHPGQPDIIRFWIGDGESYPIRMELMGDPRESYDLLD